MTNQSGEVVALNTTFDHLRRPSPLQIRTASGREEDGS